MTRGIHLFFDTETTSLPAWHDPSDAPHQPHIVQLAALLLDPDRKNMGQMNQIVRPDGWEIPEDVVKIHGITTERAMDEGVPETDVLDHFLDMWRSLPGTERVAFGEPFDARIIRIALKRYKYGEELMEEWRNAPRHCALRMAKPVCKIPPTDKMMASGRKTFKPPSLGEAYEILLGKKLEGAHDAWVDMMAAKEVFFHLREGGGVHVSEPEPETN